MNQENGDVWDVVYKIADSASGESFNRCRDKTDAVKMYLSLKFRFNFESLKICKNNEDYTQELEQFLKG